MACSAGQQRHGVPPRSGRDALRVTTQEPVRLPSRPCLVICLAVAAAVLCGTPVAAAAQSLTQTLFRNSYADPHGSRGLRYPIASTSQPLRSGSYWVATVQGTVSYYPSRDYRWAVAPWHATCGHPMAEPRFPGGISRPGPVGADAEFVFARPAIQASMCQRLLGRSVNFQIRGWHGGWSHPAILGPLPAAPLASHSYRFAAQSSGSGIGSAS